MRTLKRNKRPVSYAFYDGVTELTDDEGNLTGEYSVQYTAPVQTLMNVSGGRGQADIALFGLTQTFARTVVTEDLDTKWNTETVFWIENDPFSAVAGEAIAGWSKAGVEVSEPFDYRVVAVSRTINQVVLALAEVERSNADDNP